MMTPPLNRSLLRGLLLSLAACVLFSVGCSSTSLQRGASALKIAARRGTFEYVKRYPERRPLFELAAASLTVLVNTNADYSALAAALQTLKIREFKGDAGALLLRDGLDLLDLAISDLKPGDNSGVRVIAQALADGIGQGLAMLPVMAPMPPPPQTAIQPASSMPVTWHWTFDPPQPVHVLKNGKPIAGSNSPVSWFTLIDRAGTGDVFTLRE